MKYVSGDTDYRLTSDNLTMKYFDMSATVKNAQKAKYRPYNSFTWHQCSECGRKYMTDIMKLKKMALINKMYLK